MSKMCEVCGRMQERFDPFARKYVPEETHDPRFHRLDQMIRVATLPSRANDVLSAAVAAQPNGFLRRLDDMKGRATNPLDYETLGESVSIFARISEEHTALTREIAKFRDALGAIHGETTTGLGVMSSALTTGVVGHAASTLRRVLTICEAMGVRS